MYYFSRRHLYLILQWITFICFQWHLGFFKKQYLPRARGFDSFFGFYTGLEDYYTHVSKTVCMIGFPLRCLAILIELVIFICIHCIRKKKDINSDLYPEKMQLKKCVGNIRFFKNLRFVSGFEIFFIFSYFFKESNRGSGFARKWKKCLALQRHLRNRLIYCQSQESNSGA